jgi:hypothetical protein
MLVAELLGEQLRERAFPGTGRARQRDDRHNDEPRAARVNKSYDGE